MEQAPVWKKLQGMRRVQAEFKHLSADIKAKKFAFIKDLSLPTDDLLVWQLKLHNFDDDLPGGKALNQDLRRLQQQYGQDHLLMEVQFPADYPHKPFFVRLVSPRCVMYTGHVTAGGSICLEALTCSGTPGSWQPDLSVEGLMNLIVMNMIDCPITYIQTATGPGGLSGPLRIDFSSNPLRGYSNAEAQAAFDRTLRNHQRMGWGNGGSGLAAATGGAAAGAGGAAGGGGGGGRAGGGGSNARAAAAAAAARLGGPGAGAGATAAAAAAAAAGGGGGGHNNAPNNAPSERPRKRRMVTFDMTRDSQQDLGPAAAAAAGGGGAAAGAAAGGKRGTLHFDLTRSPSPPRRAPPRAPPAAAAAGGAGAGASQHRARLRPALTTPPAAAAAAGAAPAAAAAAAGGGRAQRPATAVISLIDSDDDSDIAITGSIPAPPQAPAPAVARGITAAGTAAAAAAAGGGGGGGASQRRQQQQQQQQQQGVGRHKRSYDAAMTVVSDDSDNDDSCKAQYKGDDSSARRYTVAGRDRTLQRATSPAAAPAAPAAAAAAAAGGGGGGGNDSGRRSQPHRAAGAAARNALSPRAQRRAAQAAQQAALAAQQTAQAARQQHQAQQLLLQTALQQQQTAALQQQQQWQQIRHIQQRIQQTIGNINVQFNTGPSGQPLPVIGGAPQLGALGQPPLQQQQGNVGAVPLPPHPEVAAGVQEQVLEGGAAGGAPRVLLELDLPGHWDFSTPMQRNTVRLIPLPLPSGAGPSGASAAPLDPLEQAAADAGLSDADVLLLTQQGLSRADALAALLLCDEGGRGSNATADDALVTAVMCSDRGGAAKVWAELQPPTAVLDREEAAALSRRLTEEAQGVLQRLEATGGGSLSRNKVLKIERVQNARLWRRFALRRQELQEARGRQGLNERMLFHGTNASTVDRIAQEGFDMRLVNHSSAYGNGVYFADQSATAYGYCLKPDNTSAAAGGYAAATAGIAGVAPAQRRGGGSKNSNSNAGGAVYKMVIARVALGQQTHGQSGMRRPPDGYDSVHGGPGGHGGAFPFCHVVFDNDQCYPEYVITLKR